MSSSGCTSNRLKNNYWWHAAEQIISQTNSLSFSSYWTSPSILFTTFSDSLRPWGTTESCPAGNIPLNSLSCIMEWRKPSQCWMKVCNFSVTGTSSQTLHLFALVRAILVKSWQIGRKLYKRRRHNTNLQGAHKQCLETLLRYLGLRGLYHLAFTPIHYNSAYCSQSFWDTFLLTLPCFFTQLFCS